MFQKLHVLYVESDGKIERRDAQLPTSIHSPPIKVTMPVDGDRREAARLLRGLAD